jgi:hypothetical protein
VLSPSCKIKAVSQIASGNTHTNTQKSDLVSSSNPSLKVETKPPMTVKLPNKGKIIANFCSISYRTEKTKTQRRRRVPLKNYT